MSLRPDIDPGAVPLPVMRPALPSADALLPYLRRMDAARVYTNFGPLAMALEARLATVFGLPRDGLVAASSGTAALVGAILGTAARATPARPLAVMPSFSFVATAVAAEQCGYTPLLLDVDPDDWALSPATVLAHPALARAGVVVPVAPFGRAVPQAPWRDFAARTGVPVVIDGAAAFEAIEASPGEFLGTLPVALSFHATKSFAVGEGGAVACRDALVVRRVAQALNFGFYGSRESRGPSTNGKLSELHAAVGLAELDGWGEKRAALHAVAAGYRAAFAASGFGHRFVGAPDIAACYALFECASADEAARARAALDAAAIGHRLWYGDGIACQPHFTGAEHGPLEVTASLAPRLLGLPTFPDLAPDDIARVVGTLAAAIRPA